MEKQWVERKIGTTTTLSCVCVGHRVDDDKTGLNKRTAAPLAHFRTGSLLSRSISLTIGIGKGEERGGRVGGWMGGGEGRGRVERGRPCVREEEKVEMQFALTRHHGEKDTDESERGKG